MGTLFTNLPLGVSFDVMTRNVYSPDTPAAVGEAVAQTLARQIGCNVVVCGAVLSFSKQAEGE
jgi:formate/nitrite transporter FocA (FNT family)